MSLCANRGQEGITLRGQDGARVVRLGSKVLSSLSLLTDWYSHSSVMTSGLFLTFGIVIGTMDTVCSQNP